MTEQMPKEQYEYIKRIQDDMLECTNMTENEAWVFAFRCWQCGYNKINKELEQYRALGTIEQLETLQDDYWKLNEMCKEYSALGTVEELRVARDKQVAKKCNIRDRIVFREGEYEPIKIKSYRCPICNHETGTCGVVPNYCMSCGHKLESRREDEDNG